jgi:hypothetical protein
MKPDKLILFNAILFIALGIGFALYGPIMIDAYGMLDFAEADGGIYWFTASFARLIGVPLFGYGLLLWAISDLVVSEALSPDKKRRIILAVLLGNILGLFVAITQQWQVWINPAGWLTIAVFAILVIGYAYTLAQKID